MGPAHGILCERCVAGADGVTDSTANGVASAWFISTPQPPST